MDPVFLNNNFINTESVSSDKENSHTNYAKNVTPPKHYSSNQIELNNSRHKTVFERQPFAQTKINKTLKLIESRSTQKHIRKLSDIHAENQPIPNIQLQKQPIKNNPPKRDPSLEGKQNTLQEHKISMKGKVLEPINIQKEKELTRQKKQQQKQNKLNDHLQTQTPLCLLKNQMEESDCNLNNFKKIQLSESTQQNPSQINNVFKECSHVMKPIKNNYKINHVFNRHQSCSFSQPVTFNLPTKSEQTLHSQKTSRFFCSQFKIFLNKRGKQHFLGTLKSNFSGSVYNFFPKDMNQTYFTIIFSSKKPNHFHQLRYCQIFINKNLFSAKKNQQKPRSKKKIYNLKDQYLLQNEQNKSQRNILKINSKLPTWSEEHQSYSLNFGSKSLLPSVKNTIFEDDNQKQVMKFFKNSHFTYEVSFQNPFSWILAYGYALASTDFKLATQ